MKQPCLSNAKRIVFGAVAALVAVLALGSIAARADTFSYDALGRLLRVDRSAGGNTIYAYDAAGNRTAVTQVVSCINATCSGTRNVVFPTRNATNAFETSPVYCDGAWTTNTSGTNYFSSCTTGWSVVSCQGLPNCPYDVPSPPQTEGGCINSVCEGTNSVVFPTQNATNAYETGPVYCAGRWMTNTSGSNYFSSCTTGWTVISCGGRANCPYSVPSPPRTEAGCVNTICEGRNTIVWPVQNGDGLNTGSQKYLCTGRWTTNTSGSNWASSCDTGWQPYP